MSFSGDLQKFASKSSDSVDRIVRAVTLELFNGVIRDTPVDTGRARGNWQTTTGAPASGELDRIGADAALAEVAAKTPSGAGQETFLSNDLPYIEMLESGGSNQAPAGMVSRNIVRLQNNVNRAVRQNKV